MNRLSTAKRAQVVSALGRGEQHQRNRPHDWRGETYRPQADRGYGLRMC